MRHLVRLFPHIYHQTVSCQFEVGTILTAASFRAPIYAKTDPCPNGKGLLITVAVGESEGASHMDMRLGPQTRDRMIGTETREGLSHGQFHEHDDC
jgi:hypothetical protein